MAFPAPKTVEEAIEAETEWEYLVCTLAVMRVSGGWGC